MSGNSKKQVSNLSNNLIRTSVHLAILAALAAGGAATRAVAQQAPATADNTPIQEVIVTGTLIKRANAETAEAVTVLKADALKDQGIVNVEQALDTLTANNPALNIAASVGTFSGGGTYANLRDLGNGRTLVLLDGQRLANNANTGNAVDLSGIPFSAIDNVQVLREGASALYGSDAIAGVINFITKKNYQGAEIQGNFDRPQDNGGGTGEVDFTIGHGDLANDGYNFMITASYSKQQELHATQREFSAAGFYPAGGYYSTNNPGTWPGTFYEPGSGDMWQSGYPACAGNPQLTTYFGNCAYRYSAATDLLPKSDESSAMLSMTKALPANNQVQLQYFYTQSEVTDWSGPMFYYFALDPASPYLPDGGSADMLRGRRELCRTAATDLADRGACDLDRPEQRPLQRQHQYRAAGAVDVLRHQRRLGLHRGSIAARTPTTITMSRAIPTSRCWRPARAAPQRSDQPLRRAKRGRTGFDQLLVYERRLRDRRGQALERRRPCQPPARRCFQFGHSGDRGVGFTVNGERFTYHTTPYNTSSAAATGLTDSAVEGSRQSQAAFIELDVPITKSLDLDLSDREDRYSDFGRTNNAQGIGALSADHFPDLPRHRLHRLPGAHAVRSVLAEFPGRLEQRHHGKRQPGLRDHPAHCAVHGRHLRHAGTGVVRRKQNPHA